MQGEDLDHSKESILTQDFDVPHFLLTILKLRSRSITGLIPTTKNTSFVMTFWPPKAMEKSSAGESVHGPKKKS